ncbi:MAG: succinate dehydrogenase/fumarate reductase iron-sulfur subunit [Spirochaetales bacterium]|nr:succinate dehydrogenase/fumarate reductase iron-sulfur subunit [Spirochaetales bacterium]
MIEATFRIRQAGHWYQASGDFPDDASVLDALEALRLRDPRGFPAYRHSCHHGSCGTCGAIINGTESLMCLTRLSELAAPRPDKGGGAPSEPVLDGQGRLVVTLEPLTRAVLIAGIAARSAGLLEGVPADAGYHVPSDPAGRADLPGDAIGRSRFDACIECGLCLSACPAPEPFIGPAALAALHGLAEREPGRSGPILDRAGQPDGVAACRKHFACSRVCPQGVAPGKRIQLLRNQLGRRPQNAG